MISPVGAEVGDCSCQRQDFGWADEIAGTGSSGKSGHVKRSDAGVAQSKASAFLETPLVKGGHIQVPRRSAASAAAHALIGAVVEEPVGPSRGVPGGVERGGAPTAEQPPATADFAEDGGAVTVERPPPVTAALASLRAGVDVCGADAVAAEAAERMPGITEGPAAGAPPHLPTMPPGCVRVGGFVLPGRLMPDEATEPRAVEAVLEETRRRFARVMAPESTDLGGFPIQLALRFMLGSDLDVDRAVSKMEESVHWRSAHNISQVRADLVMQLATTPTPPRLVHQIAVDAVFPVSPCSLTTPDGCPLTVWTLGGADGEALSRVSKSDVEAWSHAFYEYVDLWLTHHSEVTGRLIGHIQVFDLAGIGFLSMANPGLADTLKAVLSTGSHYVESVSHIFVINAGSVFSMAWEVVKTLISPRTASKIVVASDIPEELFKLIGKHNARKLQALVGDAKVAGLGLQRPPADVVEHMVSSKGTG